MPETFTAWDCHTHIFGPWSSYPLPPAPVYLPDPAPFEALLNLHKNLGIGHGVLVQGAPYGADHSALLAALEQSQGRYRGVAVVGPDVDDATLAQLHAAGVRGARVGMMRHLASGFDAGRLRAVAQRVARYNWHLQIHASLEDTVATLKHTADWGVPCVVDHMGRTPADQNTEAPMFQDFLALLQSSQAWVKVSGADRISTLAPDYEDALPVMRALLDAVPERAIWGSDWPHVNQSVRPQAARLLQLFERACGDPALAHAILVDNPVRLYD